MATARNLLYIEDDRDNIFLVQQLLKRRPHIQLTIATTGAQGLQKAQDSPPELILLDQRLPDLAGRDVLAQLRETPATATIPVVIFSGDVTLAASATTAWGADHFLPKPFVLADLLGLLDRYCAA